MEGQAELGANGSFCSCSDILVWSQAFWRNEHPVTGAGGQRNQAAMLFPVCSITEMLPVGYEAMWRIPGIRDMPNGIKWLSNLAAWGK